MKLKKIATAVTIFSLLGLMLGACGTQKNSNNSKDVIEGNISDLTKNAVDEKTKVVDGKEVKEYTMSDGNVIQIPADGQDGDDELVDDTNSDK